MRNITALLTLTDDQIARLRERGKPAVRSEMERLPGARQDGYHRYWYGVPFLYLVHDAHQRWHFGWDNALHGLSLFPAGRSHDYPEYARRRPAYNAVLVARDEAHTLEPDGKGKEVVEPALYVAGEDDINYVLGLPLL